MKQESLKIIDDLIERYEDLSNEKDSIIKSVEILLKTFKSGGKLLICGNGGSGADSLHIVGELMKGFVKERGLSDSEKKKYDELPDRELVCSNLQKGVPAIALTSESAFFTAYCNDKNPDMVFAQQVYVYGKMGDTLLAITTSGNSNNVVIAAEVAKANGLNVIGLTGCKVGRLDEYSDVIIKPPYISSYEVQERHLPIYHTICLVIEEEMFGL